jgi:hypothetical protein
MCLLSLGLAHASDKVKGKGVITMRSGNNLTVENDDDATITVMVTSDTKIQHLAQWARATLSPPTRLLPAELKIAGPRSSFW